MNYKFLAAIILVGPLFWAIVALLPTSAQSHTTGSDESCQTDPVTVTKKINSNSEKKLPGQFSGNASWYGVPFHGRQTASGEIFNMNKLTAAHLRLPLPTKVLVENPRNGNTVVIKVNDRGPYVKNRVLDLSREGARQLGTLAMGVGYVECMVLPQKPVSSKASNSSTSAGDNK